MIGIIIAAALAAVILLIIFLPVVAWSILGFIVLILLVVILIPVGVEAAYFNSEFSLSAKAGPVKIGILPKKPGKEDKPKKEKKPKEKKKTSDDNSGAETKKPAKKLNFSFEEILELLKKLFNSLGKFGKFTVHKFTLHYVAAGKDPYSTAMTFGYVNTALSSLAPICSKSLNIRGDVDVWTDVDFTRESMLIEAELSITLRLVQVLRVAFVLAFGALGVLIKNKRRIWREKRAEKKENKNLPQDNNTKDSTQKNTDTEERKDSNG